jgi:nucleotide-binding universal stress UspA family protein
MTDTRTKATNTTAQLSRKAVRPDAAQVLRVLALVDGSEATGRVVSSLLDLHSRQLALHVLVLNAQPRPQDWRMRGYGWFHRDEIHDRLINELGTRVIASVARHLDAAGISHDDRVELGHPLELLLRVAREQDCDLIVVSEPVPGPFRQWLVRLTGLSPGSTASALVQLAPLPVLVAR